MLPKWYTPPHMRKQPRILIATVMKIVEDVFEIPLEEIKSNKRHKKIVKARQAACWLLRRYCEHASFLAISIAVGRTDHSTSLHSCAVTENFLRRSPEFADKINRACKLIEESARNERVC